MNWDVSVFFEVAPKYCNLDFFVDYEGYSISSMGFLPTVVDIMVIWIKFTHSHPFSLIPRILMFTLTISSLIIFNLPWFMDLTFQVPMQSVQFSHSVVSDSLRPHELLHARPPCPSPTSGVYSMDSCPLSWWCHPIISSSVILFSSCRQSFPASVSFPVSQFFTSNGQSIGVSASASVLPMNIQDWFPLGWTGWVSLLSKGLSRVFSNTTVQKHQFLHIQPSLWSNSHIHTWPQEKP